MTRQVNRLHKNDYAEHWSEEPRSMQYQEFLTQCRISFSQDKNTFNPSKRFKPLNGDQDLIDAFNYQYKLMYIDRWQYIQRCFESCLRRNSPIKDNIIDCWNDEIVVIEYFHDEFFYIERWDFFNMEYEELFKQKNYSSSIYEEIIKRIKIIPVSTEEKSKAIKRKQLGWKSMVRDWQEHLDTNLGGYAQMTKKEWLESERISEREFASAERYIQKIKKDK